MGFGYENTGPNVISGLKRHTENLEIKRQEDLGTCFYAPPSCFGWDDHHFWSYIKYSGGDYLGL